MTDAPDAADAAPLLTDNHAASRYEYGSAPGLCTVRYRRSQGVTTLTFAEVPSALEGRGLGSRMTRAVLEAERARGSKVRATCSFIAAYLNRHPEFDDLIAR